MNCITCGVETNNRIWITLLERIMPICADCVVNDNLEKYEEFLKTVIITYRNLQKKK